MTIEDVVRDFATCGHRLPEASMRWALDHWDEFSPHFFDMLERFVRGEDKSRATADALFFSFHLAIQKGDRRAFAPLCELARRVDLLEEIFGDDVSTESLHRFLAHTYDGRAELLRALIEDAGADEFVRSAALDAFAYLTHRGDIPREETRIYLRQLHESLQPREENFVFCGLASAIMSLELVEYREIVADMLKCGLIDNAITDIEDFDAEIAKNGSAALARTFEPYADIIAEMATWYWFTAKAEQDEIENERRRTRQAARHFAAILGNPKPAPILPATGRLALSQPAGRPVSQGKVGRNDPCPCGSGMKFKKCCGR